MWKVLAVSASVITIAGYSSAWSQTPAAPPSAQPPAASAPANGPTAEDIAALGDARIAALKVGLKIKPDQEKSWAAFETAVRDLTKQRQDRLAEILKDRQAASKAGPASPGEIYRLRAKALTQTAADMTRYADALDPLYKNLDDAQKRRMQVMLSGGGRR